MRRNKQKSDFTSYIVYLKSIMKKVEKVNNIFKSYRNICINEILFVRWAQRIQILSSFLANIKTES